MATPCFPRLTNSIDHEGPFKDVDMFDLIRFEDRDEEDEKCKETSKRGAAKAGMSS
jgi:hypothetical protein